MKKSLVLIIALLLCCFACLVSCGEKEKKNDQTEAPTTTQTDPDSQKGQYNDENWLGWDTTEN